MLQGRYIHTTTQTQKKRGQAPKPRVRIETIIQVFERAHIFHVSERETNVWPL
jgi:hypothetical protein